MKIVVTGGSGFIGRYAVERLLAERHRLFLLSRDPARDKKLWNSRGRISFIRGTLGDTRQWERNAARAKPEVALHLAWEGIPDFSAAMSVKNLKYGLDAITAFSKIGCKKIICPGSCWEYGAQQGKLAEDAAPKPFNAFSAAKHALHSMGAEIAKEHDVQFIWTRLFYVYGPGQKRTSLIPYVTECFRKGELPRLNNPQGANDFIHVKDVASAFAAIVKKSGPGYGRVYNIGTGRLTSVAEVVNLAYGKAVMKKPAEMTGFYADMRRMKKEMGWTPRIGIREGIRDALRGQ